MGIWWTNSVSSRTSRFSVFLESAGLVGFSLVSLPLFSGSSFFFSDSQQISEISRIRLHVFFDLPPEGILLLHKKFLSRL